MYISKPQLLYCSSKQEIIGTYLLLLINFFIPQFHKLLRKGVTQFHHLDSFMILKVIVKFKHQAFIDRHASHMHLNQCFIPQELQETHVIREPRHPGCICLYAFVYI